MSINFTTFIICKQHTRCEQTKMISWTEIINDDNKYIIPKIISSITILVYTT